MFDFLTSEVWWMETIIAAAITAITTYLLATSKMKKGIEKTNEILEKANFIETKTEFSKEHTNLSNDHKDI